MKKTIIILSILAAILIGAVSFSVYLVNSEMVRPKLQRGIEKVFQRPVRFRTVSMSWDHGLSLQFKNIYVYTKDGVSSPPIFGAERVNIVLDVFGLLNKKLIFGTVHIVNPDFQISRDRDRNVWLQSSQEKERGVWYRDFSTSGQAQLLSAHSEIILKKFTFDKASDFQIQLALFNRANNVFLKGTVTVSSKKVVVFNNLRLETKLETWNPAELAKAVPALNKLGLENLSGECNILISHWQALPNLLEENEATAELKNVRMVFDKLEKPLEIVSFSSALHRGKRLEISRFLAKMGDSVLSVSGESSLAAGRSPGTSLKFQMDDLDLNDFRNFFPANSPRLKGKVFLGFDGSFEGIEMPQILSSLSGTGRLVLKEGVIEDFNLLREIFSKLPVGGGSAASYLPVPLQNKLAYRRTVLGPVDCAMTVAAGQIFFDGLQVFTEDWNIFAKGVISLDGRLEVQSWIRLSPAFSYAAAQGIPELQYLMTEQNFIQIPVKIDGFLKAPRLIPDTRALAASFMASKGQELITNLIQKKMKGVV